MVKAIFTKITDNSSQSSDEVAAWLNWTPWLGKIAAAVSAEC